MFRKYLQTPLTVFGCIAATCIMLAAGVNGIFNHVTSATGYQVNGTAGASGTALCSDGTNYVNSCTIPGGTIYYQTVENNGTPLTQEAFLNADATLFAYNTVGKTNIGMPNVGTAGTYASPTSITTDAQGRVSSITTGTQTDVYASTTLCAPATSTDSQCTGTITFSGLSLPNQPDGNYQPFVVVANTGSTQGASLVFNINSTLSTTGFSYTISCTFFCGTSIPSPPAYVHIHHN